MLPLFTLTLLSATPTESFALVVTNNRSLDTKQADLRYADDDGVAYTQLFDELFGAKHTVLLTVLDADTRALAPGLTGTPTPTLANLDEAVASLVRAVEAATAKGALAEVFLVFAAHGNVDEGAGYLELLDGRLTATRLEERVIKPLAAAKRLHLIIDSCNSYFMLNARKPGGRRWSAQGLTTTPLTSRYPQLGTFISTNAEAESYEWSELQSGIFSYEVRTGLRGAADADADGKVSYQELAAFVERANQDIPNAQYRPRLAWSAPGDRHATVLVSITGASSRIITSAGAVEQRFIIRDRNGARLADVHQEQGTPLQLLVPDGPNELGLVSVEPGAARPTWFYRAVPQAFRGDIDALPAGEPPTAARGDSPVFDRLFSQPFGRRAFAAFVATAKPTEAPVYGVTREDVQRLDQHLQALVEDDREARVLGAWVLSSDGGWAAFEAVRVTDVNLLVRRLHSYDLSSDEARAHAISVTERDFSSLARDARDNRLALSTLGLIAGAGLSAAGIGLGASDRWHTSPVALLSVGLLTSLVSTIALFGYQTPLERSWAEWEGNAASAPSTSAIRISLSLGAGTIGVAGTY